MAHLSLVIGQEIGRLLSCCQTDPNYLARLSDFLPRKGRLKIFTPNYDCCVEDACRNAGIDITTGFDPTSKKWNPSLFETKVSGINLYKLHGSLRGSLPPHLSVSKAPELILGPGSKVQVDDPFLTLLHEFHVALQQAKVCVAIGFSYGDEHIKTMLERAFDNGLSILDVNPSNVISSPFFAEKERYYLLKKRANEALESRDLVNCIHRYVQNGMVS